MKNENSLFKILIFVFAVSFQISAQMQFTPHTITWQEHIPDEPQALHPADMDGDGHTDIVLVDDTKIIWYRNDGTGNFFPKTVTPNIYEGPISLSIADMDNDGDLDVITGCNFDRWNSQDSLVYWFENLGRMGFVKHAISDTTFNASAIHAVDLDLDGDTDIVYDPGIEDNEKIIWLKNDGNQNFTYQILADSTEGAQTILSADIDNDGDLDLFSCNGDWIGFYDYGDQNISWFENNGSQNFTRRQISDSTDGAGSIFLTDMDADDDLDILCASNFHEKIFWYKNNGNFDFTKIFLTASTSRQFSIYPQDMDKDEDIDVLVTSNDWPVSRVLLYGNSSGHFYTS